MNKPNEEFQTYYVRRKVYTYFKGKSNCKETLGCQIQVGRLTIRGHKQNT